LLLFYKSIFWIFLLKFLIIKIQKINRNGASLNVVAYLTASSSSLIVESLTVSLELKTFSLTCYYNSTFVFDFSNIITCG